MKRDLSCEERVQDSCDSRMKTLEMFFEHGNFEEYLYDEDDCEIGSFQHYHLDFSYTEPFTYDDQPYGYWVYQISCGGPQEEIRYITNNDGVITEVQYWFLDWFDGAYVVLSGDHLETAMQVYNYWEPVTDAPYKQKCTPGENYRLFSNLHR